MYSLGGGREPQFEEFSDFLGINMPTTVLFELPSMSPTKVGVEEREIQPAGAGWLRSAPAHICRARF